MERNRFIPEKETLNFAAAVLLIVLFGYTAISKILEYDKFVFQMKLAPVPFMTNLAPILGVLVIATELIIVSILALEKWRMIGMYASFLLLLSFEIYITIMLLSSSKLPCTCGGIISTMGWKTHLAFNALFMLITLIPIVLNHKNNAKNPMNIRRISLRE